MEEYLARSEKVKTQEEVQKLTLWQNESLNAIIKKKCGDDPRPLISKETERFTKAQFEGAMEFAKVFRKPAPRHDAGNREQDDAGTGCAAMADLMEDDSPLASPSNALCLITDPAEPLQEQPNAGTDQKVLEYLRTIELVTKFCSLSKEMRQDAMKNGIRVPGTGDKIFWVFSKDFANWVGDSCDDVLKLIMLVNK
jgi:hypothetical protein